MVRRGRRTRDNNLAISKAREMTRAAVRRAKRVIRQEDNSQETDMIMVKMGLLAIVMIAEMDNAAAAIRMAKDRGKAKGSQEDRVKVNRGKEVSLDRAKGKVEDVAAEMEMGHAMSVAVESISSDWAEQ